MSFNIAILLVVMLSLTQMAVGASPTSNGRAFVRSHSPLAQVSECEALLMNVQEDEGEETRFAMSYEREQEFMGYAQTSYLKPNGRQEQQSEPTVLQVSSLAQQQLSRQPTSDSKQPLQRAPFMVIS